MRRIGTCCGLSDEDLLRIDAMNQAVLAFEMEAAHEEARRMDGLLEQLAFAERGSFEEETGLELVDPDRTLPREWTTERSFESMPAREAEVVDFDLVAR